MHLLQSVLGHGTVAVTATLLGTPGVNGGKTGIAEGLGRRYSIAPAKNAPVAQLDRAFDYENHAASPSNPRVIRN
jgi:hypothetical protein